MRIAYLNETIRIRVHRISDTMPMTVSDDSVPPAAAACLSA